MLISFSTGFTSTADNADNADKAAVVEREMEIKLDGESVRVHGRVIAQKYSQGQ